MAKKRGKKQVHPPRKTAKHDMVDFSKKTLAILIAVVIAMSIFGTWLVVNNSQTKTIGTVRGTVQLEILPNARQLEEKFENRVGDAQVSLTILN